MAEISERKKDGKVVSFKFLACLGRDEAGKRIMRATTWKPPEGLSLPKARKMAEAEAYAWECALRGQEQKGEYTNAQIQKHMKEMRSAAKDSAFAALTTLGVSMLRGDIQQGNADAAFPRAEDKLANIKQCPNCKSENATEITAEEAAAARNAAAAPASSAMDELKKLKELLDMGIVTLEEFDAKKKQLLGL